MMDHSRQAMARHTDSALKSWEHPKKSKIHIREVMNANGGDWFGASYLVTIPSKLTGKLRERRQFKEREEALKWADEKHSGFQKEGQGYFALTDGERREVSSSLAVLRKHGISLADAVRFAVKRMRHGGKDKTVREVVAELIASKEQRFQRGDLRERSYRDFRHRAEKFASGFENRIAAEVSGKDIKDWLIGQEVGSRTNKNYLSVVGELFRYAGQKRYVSFSPLDVPPRFNSARLIA